MAIAKIHKREANHNSFKRGFSQVKVGWLLRRYINGKPITTRVSDDKELVVLDGYCEDT